MYDKMIDTAETQGYIASQKYYNALISTESSNISKLQLQYSSLTSARNEAMKAGNIAKYSEEWYSMTDSINSVEEAIQDANKSLIEYKNNLRQVNWDFFDKQEDYISKLQDESDWLIDLITTENKLFNSDNGKIMKDAADKKAREEIKRQQAAQQAISKPASSSSSSSSSFNSNSSNSGSSSGSSGWGSWFVHKADSYPKSKLRINSSIVDRLKLHNFDSSQSARSGYYKAMGGSGTYVGSASQNNWMISEMKKHGFKQGGTIGKLIRSTGEDGFVLARTGEEILSKEKLIMLKDALQYIPQNFNIASTSLPKFTQKASNSSVDVKVDFGGITMNGVNNPEEFVTELQKSKRFEKIVQSITVDTAMGKNSLGKYRF